MNAKVFLVAIGVVLAAVAIYVFVLPPGGNTFEMAKRTATIANTHQLMRAFLLYVPDAEGRVPANWHTADDLKKALGPHVDPDLFTSHNPNDAEFIPNPEIAGKKLSDLAAPETVVVLMESKPWPDGTRAIGYADGHVKRGP